MRKYKKYANLFNTLVIFYMVDCNEHIFVLKTDTYSGSYTIQCELYSKVNIYFIFIAFISILC